MSETSSRIKASDVPRRFGIGHCQAVKACEGLPYIDGTGRGRPKLFLLSDVEAAIARWRATKADRVEAGRKKAGRPKTKLDK